MARKYSKREWHPSADGKFILYGLSLRQGILNAKAWKVGEYTPTGQKAFLWHSTRCLAGQKEEAKQAAERWFIQIQNEDRKTAGEKVALRKAVLEFLDTRKDNGIRPKSLIDYNTKFAFLLKYFDPDKKKNLSDISPADIQGFIRQAKEKKRSVHTILDYLFYLRRFFDWAVKMDYLEKNPSRAVEMPKVPVKDDDEDGAALELEQMRKLLGVVGPNGSWPDSVLFETIVICFFTGLRIKNVLDLDWKRHVDLVRRVITIPGSEMKAHRKHSVPICTALYEFLWAMPSRAGLVIQMTQPTMTRRYRVLHKRLQKSCLRAGIPKVGFHCFRRTFGTMLADAGVPWATIARLMAHSLKGVFRGETATYIKKSIQQEMDAKEAVERLPNLLPESACLPLPVSA